MAKFFCEFMIIFIAKVEKVNLIRHLGIKACEEVEVQLYALFIQATEGQLIAPTALPCGEKLRVLIRQETGWDPDRV
jgi:hypothetical protein